MSSTTARSPHVALSAPFGRALAGFLRAYQLQAAVLWSLRLFALGLALDLVALAVQRLVPRVDVPLPLLAVPPLLGVVVGAMLGATRRPSTGWLAVEVDRRLGLHERTVTALELLGGVRAAGAAAAQLGRDQIEDSIDHLRRAEPGEAFPLRVPRREAIAAAVLALALAPLVVLGPAVKRDAGPRVDQLARAEAERITALADELQQEQTDDPEPVNGQTAGLLRQVAQQLQDAQNSPDKAMAQLGDGERKLSSLQRTGALDTAQALGRLADALDREARTRDAAAALDQRNYKQAAQELQKVAQQAAQGSDADRQAISQALRQGAQAAGRYDDRLAQALNEAADRTGRGESGAADNAAQQMARAGSEMNRQETLERAMSQLQNSRQAIGNAGRASQPSGGQRQPGQGGQSGQGNQAGQGQQGDQGDGQGQGQGQGQGDGQNGQGQGQGQGQGNQPGDGQGSGAGTGTQARSTDVYNPADVRSRQVQVPGGDFDRPQVSQGDQTDSADGEARVDYRDVLPTYQQRATKAMQDRYIPLGMKDLVRDYFSSLNPGQNGQGGGQAQPTAGGRAP